MLEKQGNKIRLGDYFADVVTGVHGTATAQCRSLTRYDTVRLERTDQDGKHHDEWVDIIRLEWQASASCPELAAAKAAEDNMIVELKQGDRVTSHG